MTTPARDPAALAAVLRRVRTLEGRVNRLLDSGLSGAYRSVFRGQGLEAEGLREYALEDDAARIDWAASGRLPRPHLRLYREERELRCLLLLDVSASMGGRACRETAAAAVALLALAAVRNRDRVGLLRFSTRIEGWLPPSRSPRQALRLLREVEEMGSEAPGTDLGLALATAARLEPQRGLVVLISDLRAPLPEAELARLLRRHEVLVLCLTEGGRGAWPRLPAVWVEDAETGRCLALRPDEATEARWQTAVTAERERARGLVCRGGGDWCEVPCGPEALTHLGGFLVRRAQGRGGGRRREVGR